MRDGNFFDCYARLPGACEAYGQAITDIWWVFALYTMFMVTIAIRLLLKPKDAL